MKRIIFILILAVSLVALSGCDFIDSIGISSPNDETETQTISEISVQNPANSFGFVLEEFSLEDFNLIVTYDSEEKKVIPFETSFVSPSDLDKLDETGLHSLTISYEDVESSFDVRLFESLTDKLLYVYYDSVLEAQPFEAWKAELEGDNLSDKLSYTLHSLVDKHFEDKAVIKLYDDDQLIDFDIVALGETYNAPTLEKEGYTFTEWSNDNFTVEDSKSLEASFEKNTYTVTFDVGNDITTFDVLYGEVIPFITPALENKVFLGWYLDETFERPYTYDEMPAKNLTLYPKLLDIEAHDQPDDDQNDSDDNQLSIESVINKVSDGVLGIQNIQNGSVSSTGSGVIYKQDNNQYYVFTNYHVVNEADSIDILFEKNGNALVYENVTLIGEYEGADIAVLRFESDLDFEVLSFRDAFEVAPGMEVYAIGSPLGFQYFNSVTKGIISKVDVQASAQDIEIDAYFFQHDAAINPGNSGGVLIDNQGFIVGMNTLKQVGDDIDNMGFALKSNIIERMVDQLESEGTITRALIGITSTDIIECEAFFGACVSSTSENGTAFQLGIEENDLVTGIKTDEWNDYLDVPNFNRFRHIILTLQPGDLVSLEYIRDGETFTTEYAPLNE